MEGVGKRKKKPGELRIERTCSMKKEIVEVDCVLQYINPYGLFNV